MDPRFHVDLRRQDRDARPMMTALAPASGQTNHLWVDYTRNASRFERWRTDGADLPRRNSGDIVDARAAEPGVNLAAPAMTIVLVPERRRARKGLQPMAVRRNS